jgi:hypothetical protein
LTCFLGVWSPEGLNALVYLLGFRRWNRDELVHRLRVAFGQREQGQLRVGVPAEGYTPNVVPYEEIYEGITQVLGKGYLHV